MPSCQSLDTGLHDALQASALHESQGGSLRISAREHIYAQFSPPSATPKCSLGCDDQDLDELLQDDGTSILIERSVHGGMHARVGGRDLRVNVRDEEAGEGGEGRMALDGRTSDDEGAGIGNDPAQGLGH